jgi:hypothetical protein
MGCLNETTADYESLFAVKVIARAVAVVLQILQQKGFLPAALASAGYQELGLAM